MVSHRFIFALVTIFAILATSTSAVSAQDSGSTTIPITGHGWGHGRGMSQYGALGYAIDQGWSSEQILNHYYGDTTAGAVPNSLLTVRLRSADNQATVVQVDSGTPVLFDMAGEVTHVSTGRALRLTAVDGGFLLADAPTCAGPFVDRPEVINAEQLRISTVATPLPDSPLAELEPRLSPNLPISETIQRCVSANEQRYYRGELRAVRNNGAQRTVNAVTVEWYLRAVVPREMPASWALLGNGAGAAALEAQAVSARSYSLAENRTSYARTCDTISCQVYDGRATRINGQLSSNEDALSNAAISNTSGVVRMRDGEVARTEFSSSTGGWTAGGLFPAVVDHGDSVSLNPNHDWATSVRLSTIEARYGNRTLDRVYVSERNGLGEDGGRVLGVTLEFGSETFKMDGNEFRRLAGLKSDWFSINWERGPSFANCLCPEEFDDDRQLFLRLRG